VLHARLPATTFLQFALANLPRETSDGVLPQVIATVQQALNFLRLMSADDARAVPAGKTVEEFLWSEAAASQPGSDRQLVLFDTFVEVAATAPAIERLAALVDEEAAPPVGIRLDQDRRWSLLLALGRTGLAGIEDRVADEARRDPSDQGRLRAIAVRAAQPSLDVKRAWLRRVLDGGALPLADLRAAATALFPALQNGLYRALAGEILEGLPTLDRVRQQGYFGSFVAGFLGPACDGVHLQRLETAIAAAGDLHPILQRGLRNSRFDVARCLRIAEITEAKKKSPT
jgi:aminopeptidase N